MDDMQNTGLDVFRNGYPLIPIVPRDKRPALGNWRNINATEELVKSWRGGIGIRTGFVVFIDIDIPNVAADRVRAICERIVGPAPVRIGNAPKLGLLYRSETVLKTRISTVYKDKADNRCAIEALADGRQFVAYGIHPITGNPYDWVTWAQPTNTKVEDLTLITEAQIEELFTAFDQVALEESWALATISRSRAGGETPFWVKTGPVTDLTDDQIAEYVRRLPNDEQFESRESWLKIGMAIHHQTGGSEEGRELFRDWSVDHPSHNEENFRKAWDSLGNDYSNPNFNPITFRYIIDLVEGIKRAERKATLERLEREITDVTSLAALTKIGFEISTIDMEAYQRVTFASQIQDAAKRFRARWPIGFVRELVRPKPGDKDMPDWLKDWVFLSETDQFYNVKTTQYVGPNAFNRAFGRWVKDIPASRFATDLAKIPVHHRTAYLPTEGAVYIDPLEISWVNTYRDTSPAIPAEYDRRDLAAIETVKAHATHLFGDAERDIAILHSALAYIVQTGQRINWLLLIQGAEAIGKTFYAHLMRAVLGGDPHVFELSTEILTESNFTGWANGHQVVYIEELKLHGKRYDVLNKMKPYISNEYIGIHAKYQAPYNVRNTTSYFAFTNHRDALPLNEGDTRHFIMLSQWQNGNDVRRFKEENPDYYRRLWATLDECAGALRRWLLEYDLHPDFSPVDRAPASAGREIVLREAKPEFQQDVEDIIADGLYPWISNDLVIVHLLREVLADDIGSVPPPEGIRNILQRMQFTPVNAGRISIGGRGKRMFYYCWSRNRDVIRASVPQLREIIDRALASRL